MTAGDTAIPAPATATGGALSGALPSRRLIALIGLWLIGLLASLILYGGALTRGNFEFVYEDRSPLLGSLWLLGLSPAWQVLFNRAAMVAGYLVFPLLSYAVGGLIAWRRPRDWLALLVSIMLITGAPALPGLLWHSEGRLPWLIWAAAFLANLTIFLATFMFVPFLFPDGRAVPRRVWLLPAAALAALIASLLIGLLDPEHGLGLPEWMRQVPPLLVVAALLGGVASQIHRYRRLSTPAQRQQTRWVTLGLCLSLPFFATTLLADRLSEQTGMGPWGLPQPLLSAKAAMDLVALPLLLVLPLCVGLAVLRSRLWGIDPLINRTLVYAALTAGVLAAYAGLVGGLSLLFQTGGNPAIALLATGLVAIAFQPARQRVQRAVNRLMYGDRDDPYAVLARLGQRLELGLTPETALPTIVQTVREALRLPAVAITIPAARRDEAAGAALPDEVVAAAGPPPSGPLRLPLMHAGEPVGQLLLEPRAPDEAFSAADRRLLDDVARLAGLALHAMRLTADVQRSRQRLVTAREEERRRLRRDLHDGLGADLAALTLQIGALRPLIGRDPAAAAARVPELQEEARAAVAAIRRLVYGLRPPTLDELGLVGALRARAGRLPAAEAADGAAEAEAAAAPAFAVEAPDALPGLPAAVEVAAYWIVQEALTNVLRHARARQATVRLTAAGEVLTVEVADDGVGLPAERRAGVGLRSMRERADEVGGTLEIGPGAGGGVRVVARLPLLREE